ncbi:MAG: type II toxin-antitoxin system RelE/ParE family toxin [Sphingomonas sp.]|uniref:type II toxin-antitoxin system RelE/ParE family toxin n=1 Tax=Sphingomonas sp. TaxID=28214 RepID=UPI001AC4D045|nr:type II toxin-antitoxin system RelE/ParE family toxin [Sphingomonas sp.]MBN8808989.1 type II toxin-antitoxin system RelE/ParE family toxin [Sphingomonas sp.]
MTDVTWSDEAIADLEAIDDYWMSYSEERAEQIAERIERAAAFLATMPHAGPAIRRADARKWRVTQTMYILIYRVLDQQIDILRIHHGREDWQVEP